MMGPFPVGPARGTILAVTAFSLSRRDRRALRDRETLSTAIMFLPVTLLLFGTTVTF
jgi:hypothetical protein